MNTLPEYLYTPAQVQELDRRAIQDHGLPGLSLMERAGRRGWEVLLKHWPHVRRLRVLCGGGNNGGDGYVVARLARRAGLGVRLQALSDPDRLNGDAATVARRFQEEGGRSSPGIRPAWRTRTWWWTPCWAPAWTGRWRALPGGVAGAEGGRRAGAGHRRALGAQRRHRCRDGEAVEAHCTVTFIGLKPGLLTGAGPQCAGTLYFDDLGVPPEIYQDMAPVAGLCRDELLRRCLGPRPAHAHKGQFGHALVIGGDLGMGGAARMAGEAAGRTGAGLVSVATRPAHVAALLAARPELMVHGLDSAEGLAPLLEKATAWALGPGLGQGPWGRALWEAALRTEHPCVLDADALNLLAADPRPCPNALLTPTRARRPGCWV